MIPFSSITRFNEHVVTVTLKVIINKLRLSFLLQFGYIGLNKAPKSNVVTSKIVGKFYFLYGMVKKVFIVNVLTHCIAILCHQYSDFYVSKNEFGHIFLFYLHILYKINS